RALEIEIRGRDDLDVEQLVTVAVDRMGSLLPRSFRSLLRASRRLRGPRIYRWSVTDRAAERPLRARREIADVLDQQRTAARRTKRAPRTLARIAVATARAGARG